MSMQAVAVQAVCEELYHHEYYLTKEEVIQKDTNLVQYKEQNSSAPKKQCLDELKQPSKQILLKKDYAPYKYVLPSARTPNNYKQLLAVQPEADAVNALLTVPSNVQCTLHYCMTSLCKIDAEWPSIIFSFPDNERYILHEFDFVYENHTQIIILLLETCKWLVLLNDEQRTTAKELWEETKILMTDSVQDDPQIENGIVAALGSNHIPQHLLCKAHTVEALDISNINVLASLESSLKFREAPESINACVKSFVRGEESVVN